MTGQRSSMPLRKADFVRGNSTSTVASGYLRFEATLPTTVRVRAEISALSTTVESCVSSALGCASRQMG